MSSTLLWRIELVERTDEVVMLPILAKREFQINGEQEHVLRQKFVPI